MSKDCEYLKRSIKFELKNGNAKVNLTQGLTELTGDNIQFHASNYLADDLEEVKTTAYEPVSGSGSDSDEDEEVDITKQNSGLVSIATGVAGDVIKNVAIASITKLFIGD